MKQRDHSEGLLPVIHGESRVDDVAEFDPTVVEELDVLILCDLASFNEVDPFGSEKWSSAVGIGQFRRHRGFDALASP